MEETDPHELVPVRFLTSNLPYNAGEVAGFSRAICDRYVAEGKAEYLDPNLDVVGLSDMVEGRDIGGPPADKMIRGRKKK